MVEGRRVLITGIAGELAGMVARALEDRDDVLEIVGIDVREPQHDLRRTEFVRADLRNPLVARVLEAAAIDTVLHLSTTSAPREAGGRSSMKERNVLGAMQLAAACQTAPSLRRFVLKSTTAVYGSDHTDPALFREEATPRTPARGGFGKDATEIEGYIRALGRRRDDVAVSILRFANLVGPQVDSAFHSLFSLPVLPTVAGFDPRLQFCHEDDAVAVLRQVALGDHPGVVNVAGDGVLYLSQCVRLAGRVAAPVPWPFVSGLTRLLRQAGRADVSLDQLRVLQYGRVVDTRRLREELGFTPSYSTRAAFEDFLHHRRIQGVIDRGDVVRWEREVYDFLQRKGQERFLDAQRAHQEDVR
ncbi:MAG: NAD-dependent epimerase/dehydratase family protein [Nitriliruptoraceae bacterium]